MKSCDEMVNSLLCRREKFFTEQKRKRKINTHTHISEKQKQFMITM